MSRPILALAGVLTAAAIAFPATAGAAPPSNDAFAAGTSILSLPFSDVVNTTEATTEPSEPQPCWFISQSIWYSFTPATTEVVAVDTSGSGSTTAVNLYRQNGSGLGGLGLMSCTLNPSSTTFTAQAGATYEIQTGMPFGTFGDLHLNVHLVPAPANDDFVNAKAFGSVPFSDSVDMTAATVESGEPAPACGFGQSPGTVWFAFTPSVTASYSASPLGGNAQVAVYTGSVLGGLTQLVCRGFGQPLTFHADAGTTYYVQLGGIFGSRGTLSFTLDITPPPVASYYYNVGDPSIFDTVQFGDQSYDPGGIGIVSEAWSFGDGTTGSGAFPTHHYVADGDYTVKLTVTTTDGRAGSTSRVVHVQTHDVTIAKLTVPQSASVGQTRSISVGLTDNRYPETVQVQLLRSTAGGWTNVGTLIQSIPVRGATRTTSFAFTYTFTRDDASVGKVSFRAIATIQGARDALPGDNDVIALPTKVS